METSITNIRTGLLYEKNRLTIFFLIHFLRVGVGAEPGKPVPVGGRSGGEIFIPVGSGSEAGRGWLHQTGSGVLKPAPALPRCHVYAGGIVM